jgi:hypothetical protein
VAVTVEDSPSVVLDEHDLIVECNAAARPWFEHNIGRSVYSCFPGSTRLFRPYYDRARRTGQVVEFAQCFDGYVTHVRAMPTHSTLRVTWETLAILDTTTAARLLSTIDEAIGRLDDLMRGLERERAKRSLRVVRDVR